MNSEDITPPEDTENIGPLPILPVKKGALQSTLDSVQSAPIIDEPEPDIE